MENDIVWGPELKARVIGLVEAAIPRENLILVSPYVNLDRLQDLVRALSAALARGVRVGLIIRSVEQWGGGRPTFGPAAIVDELRQKGLQVREIPNLHAKLYLGEREAILTSLNLLDSSFANSIELGVIVREPARLERLKEFVRRELNPHARAYSPERVEEERETGRRPRATPEPPDVLATAAKILGGLFAARETGYCIRCAGEIPLDESRPYCGEDYASWSRYENPDYKDKCCHGCGADHGATMRKPFCKKCFRELRG